MSSDRDPRFTPADEPDEQFEDEEAPRSIFSAAWFRVVVVVLAVGVIGAIAVPYVLDVVNAPTTAPMSQTASAPAPAASTLPATTPSAPASSESTTAPAAPAESTTSAKSAAPTEGASAPASPPPAPVAKAEEKPKAPEKAPTATAAPKAAATPSTATAKKEAPAERTTTAKAAPAPARPKRSESSGDYFVQVGAFQDQATAKRLVTRLREQNYPVDESATRGGGTTPSAAPRSTPRVAAASGPDRYDVIVSGGSTAEVNSKLSAKGLASEPAGDSVKIRPSLSLRDAVALSKDLGSEGFKVQVRRGAGANGAPVAAEPAPSGAAGDGPTLHRVRVGPYPDRATALSIHKEFQDKGYSPFIARGRE